VVRVVVRGMLGMDLLHRRNVLAPHQIDLGQHLFRARSNVGVAVDRPPEGIFLAFGPQQGAAHVFPDAELGKDIGDLEGARKSAPVDLIGRQLADRNAVEPDFAGTGGEQSADQIEQGRFAGTIGTNDGVALAFGDGKIDAADDLGRPDALAQPPRLKRHWARRRAHGATGSQAAAPRRQARRPSTAPASSAANANVHASRLVASNVMPANVMVVPSAALTPRCVVISITSTAAPPTSASGPSMIR